MVASMILVIVGRRSELQRHMWTMVQSINSEYSGGFPNFRMAERDISANASQRTCWVSLTWPGQWIKSVSPSGTRPKLQCTPQSTSSTKRGVILWSFWQSSSIEAVAKEVFYGSCGYMPHASRHGQWWMHKNAPQVPGFMQSLCIHN